MSKAILVIDAPKGCGYCPCLDYLYFGAFCGVTNSKIEYDFDTGEYKRPDWCPLLPLPERKDTSHLTGATLDHVVERQYKQGFNDCLYLLNGGII